MDCQVASTSNGIVRVEPHPNTERPWEVYQELFNLDVYPRTGVVPMPLDTPVYGDKVRFVCLADTHSKLGQIVDKIPPGDVLIHAGDFTNSGHPDEIHSFNTTLGSLPHRHKLVVAGNHDVTLDDTLVPLRKETTTMEQKELAVYGVKHARELLTNCTYLQDSAVTLYGYKVYGTPWHPMPHWAFYRARGRPLLDKWDRIPDDTDVLVTHTPPLGHGDAPVRWKEGMLCGCVELLHTVQLRVKPLFHVYGHIHPGHGSTTNGATTFINAAICDKNCDPIQPPIIFDLPLKEGTLKE